MDDWAQYFRNRREELDASRAEDAGSVKGEITILVPGKEVPLDSVLKKTKAGSYSTQSTMGKIAVLAMSLGWDVRAGKSVYVKDGVAKDHIWIAGATNGHRFATSGTSTIFDGVLLDTNGTVSRLEEIGVVG